jgi:hypothetical protein
MSNTIALFSSMLTPWIKVHFKNLIVIRFVNKPLAFFKNPTLNHCVQKIQLLDHVVRQMNTDHTPHPVFFRIHFNIISPSTLMCYFRFSS